MQNCSSISRNGPPFEVVKNLYRGPLPDNLLLDELEDRGVIRVISLCNEPDAAETLRAECGVRGLQHCHIPLSPFARPDDCDVAYFLKLLEQRDAFPTYVHCIHGRDRTGTMLGIFRMSQGWSFAEAFEEMRSYGFYVGFQELLSAMRHYNASVKCG